ncbi:DUF6913 domain-containing protein [Pseudofulvibacter geojedonensis]|uniref:DUF6913 domain-containing protein n=1 Tax=Pseudofulvibacter geojedonensis TaxID=1123758 RepID=A0ABW3HZL4_9FLAO
MFLKGFKQKSAKKILDKQLRISREISKQKIKTIGVLVDATVISEFSYFKELATLFEIPKANIELLYYHPNKKEALLIGDNAVHDGVLGFGGKLNHEIANKFLGTSFDALLNYYPEDKLLLNLLSVRSKAKFKIGFVGTNELMNDLAIKTSISNIDVFTKELKKYLPILNQI